MRRCPRGQSKPHVPRGQSLVYSSEKNTPTFCEGFFSPNGLAPFWAKTLGGIWNFYCRVEFSHFFDFIQHCCKPSTEYTFGQKGAVNKAAQGAWTWPCWKKGGAKNFPCGSFATKNHTNTIYNFSTQPPLPGVGLYLLKLNVHPGILSSKFFPAGQSQKQNGQTQ